MIKLLPKSSEQSLAEWKANRAEAVSNLVVDVGGKLFNGDELSQARMGRTWVLMEDLATTEWSLADTQAGVMTVVTKEELKKACELAGKEQTRLWKVS